MPLNKQSCQIFISTATIVYTTILLVTGLEMNKSKNNEEISFKKKNAIKNDSINTFSFQC